MRAPAAATILIASLLAASPGPSRVLRAPGDALTAPQALADPAADRQPLPAHEAFGFRLGEQRRYALGPPEILKAGEFEVWTLRLDEIDGDRPIPRYTFTYGRELSLIDERQRDQMNALRAHMSVTVNQYGFPLDIRYGSRDVDASDDDWINKNGRLGWERDRFFFDAPESTGGERFSRSSFSFALPDHDGLDVSLPAGLFLSETENPALISLSAAVFQEIGAARMEFLALRPNRIGRQRARRRGRGRGERGFGANPGRRADVVRADLEFRGIEEIEIGGRRYEAIRLDSSESDDDVFIREDGALLRLDLDFRNYRNAHVRLLHPSEY